MYPEKDRDRVARSQFRSMVDLDPMIRKPRNNLGAECFHGEDSFKYPGPKKINREFRNLYMMTGKYEPAGKPYFHNSESDEERSVSESKIDKGSNTLIFVYQAAKESTRNGCRNLAYVKTYSEDPKNHFFFLLLLFYVNYIFFFLYSSVVTIN